MSDEVELFDKRTGELIHFRPTNPVEMEYLITEIGDLIEQLPDKLKEINHLRYDAERAYSLKRNSRLDFWMDQGLTATQARARAEIDAAPELEDLHQWKAAFHYAEDSLKALTAKHAGLCNVNKGVQQAYGAYGRRSP